jgi:hypothetical protein
MVLTQRRKDAKKKLKTFAPWRLGVENLADSAIVVGQYIATTKSRATSPG